MASRQYAWQEERRRRGLCRQCGRRKLATRHLCKRHAKQVAERMRLKRQAAVSAAQAIEAPAETQPA